MDAKTLAGMIDHTLLKPEATSDQIEKLCTEAMQYGFASVCVNGVYVPLASEKLRGSTVKVCTVVGFPLGAMHPFAKAYEAKIALEHGATEIDMVLSIGDIKSENISAVHHDIASVVAECQLKGAICKVILETSLLTDQEKVIACRVCMDAGADFVKTSTGFSTGGATVDDVRLMRQTVGADMGVKASGGIRNLTTALAMIEAGANRLGVSAGVAIIDELSGGLAQGGDGY
ncbi:MAG: deoxyribose-phosphate aldolase [Anaerolineae bacterium]|nr:deoxyribose-phosphate aldolase [Anaerolineae bacterium]